MHTSSPSVSFSNSTRRARLWHRRLQQLKLLMRLLWDILINASVVNTGKKRTQRTRCQKKTECGIKLAAAPLSSPHCRLCCRRAVQGDACARASDECREGNPTVQSTYPLSLPTLSLYIHWLEAVKYYNRSACIECSLNTQHRRLLPEEGPQQSVPDISPDNTLGERWGLISTM